MAGEQRAIAAALNLSEATVSRSLKNHPRISAVTRARVAEVAVRMGLRPKGADAMEGMYKPAGDKNSTGMIRLGALCRASTSAGSANDAVALKLIQGMSLAARASRATLHVEYLSREEFDRLDDPRLWPPVIQERVISGVAVFADLHPGAVEALSPHLPCVQFVAPGPKTTADSVTEDNVRAMGQLFDHLVSLGHSRIGLADFGYNSPTARSRLVGYIQALIDRGMPYDPANCRLPGASAPAVEGDFTADPSRASAVADHVLARRRHGVTAWICINDLLGYQLISQLQARDVKVPQDLSVCGFDNFDPPTGLPKLTTMEGPFEAIGRATVRRLMLRATERVGEPLHIMFGCKLIEGASTGPV